MNNIKSALILNNLVFDKIEFSRKGFKNENDIEFDMKVEIGKKEEEEIYKVTLILKGDKKDEYIFEISLSGYFIFDETCELDEQQREKVISTNAVSIIMPYLRSEVSLLTAQPETECVVLPPFNINKMMKDASNS